MAETIHKIKNKIIQKVKSLSPENLKTLDEFLNQLEHEDKLKDEILSFAGAFNEMDEDFFNDLTEDLPANRTKGTIRIL